MNIVNFFPEQKRINSHIKIDTTLSDYKLFARKHLQLHVRLSDLANETSCYKYWIDGEKILDSNTIFEKYILCFKQIITLGLDKKYDDVDEITITPSEYCLSDQFINLYIDVNDLIISPSKDHYITILEDFLSLGVSLGYTEQQIIDGFYNIADKKVAL